jgi:hypothetical protein
MSPYSTHDMPVSKANMSPQRPLKRPRLSLATICPAVLTGDGSAFSDQCEPQIVDLTVSPSQYSPSIEEEAELEYHPSPSDYQGPYDTTSITKLEGGDCDTLFSQYLRSPSPSPSLSLSPEDVASQYSRSTLADTGCVQPRRSVRSRVGSFESIVPDIMAQSAVTSPDREDTARDSVCSRIRLRVSQPKITLRLKLQDTK